METLNQDVDVDGLALGETLGETLGDTDGDALGEMLGPADAEPGK